MLGEDGCSLMPEIRASCGLVVVVWEAGLVHFPGQFLNLSAVDFGGPFLWGTVLCIVGYLVVSVDLYPLGPSNVLHPQF